MRTLKCFVKNGLLDPNNPKFVILGIKIGRKTNISLVKPNFGPKLVILRSSANENGREGAKNYFSVN